MNAIYITTIMAFLISGCHHPTDSNTPHIRETSSIVYVQPLANIDPLLSNKTFGQLKNFIPIIKLLNPIPIPTQAYYKPHNRFRADSIIHYLSSITAHENITIGLTDKDISTTKGDIQDWGVMGLGYRPGNACVASSKRLSPQKKGEQFFKVCIHELGHTMGLSHCPEKTCFMRDAEGGNPTDEETCFCSKCKKYLKDKGWNIR